MEARDVYRIAIADDNKAHLAEIAEVVKGYFGNNIQKTCHFNSADELTEYLENNGFVFDIALLDIDLNGGSVNGIDAAERIDALNPLCQIIFISGFIDYAKDIYKAEHIYFVLKSEIKEKLPRALEKAGGVVEENRGKSLLLSLKGRDMVVNINDILFIERMRRITQINLTDDIISTYEPIEQLITRIDSERFVQCHKSYAVNISKISTYRKSSVTLKNNKIVPISRTHSREVSDRFMRYMGNFA
jgi:DNA-binding LytR/AlgR family response regulator